MSKFHSSIGYENYNFFYNNEKSTSGSTQLIKKDEFS